MQLLTTALILLTTFTPDVFSAGILLPGVPAVARGGPKPAVNGRLSQLRRDPFRHTMCPRQPLHTNRRRLQPRSFLMRPKLMLGFSIYPQGTKVEPLPDTDDIISLVTWPDGRKMIEKKAVGNASGMSLHDEFTIHKHAYEMCPDHVMKPLGYIDSLNPPVMHVVYAAGGNVVDAFLGHIISKELKDVKLKPLFLQVAKGLECLHMAGIAHWDFKFENLVIDTNGVPFKSLSPKQKLQGIRDGRFKLKFIDFGYADFTMSGKNSRRCGSPWYMPKEVLIGPVHAKHGPAVDIGGFALSILNLLREYPFPVQTPRDIFKNRLERGDLHFKVDSPTYWGAEINAQLYDLLKHMLEDLDKRLDIHRVLAHPFFGDAQQANPTLSHTLGLSTATQIRQS